MKHSKPQKDFVVEALMMDYNIRDFRFQAISPPMSHTKARKEAFYASFDFSSVRLVPACNAHLAT